MGIPNYLSPWEVSHRWHNIDPNKTDPENLPLEVQDSLRFLCRAVLSGNIGLYDEVFISIDQDQHRPRREARIFEIDNLPEEIEECVASRKYTKAILDGYLIERVELFSMSVYRDQPFPDFWFDDNLVIAVGGIISSNEKSREEKEVTARQSVIDKELCQAVASTLWAIDPKINIAQMTKHPSVLKYGNGGMYKGKNTLRDWLREVAPEHLKNKPGRPKIK